MTDDIPEAVVEMERIRYIFRRSELGMVIMGL